VKSISTNSQLFVKSCGVNRIGTLRRLTRPGGMTQKQLADLAGLSVRELRRVEAGEVTPKAPVLIGIAHALRVPTSELMDATRGTSQATGVKRVLAVSITLRRAVLVCIDQKFSIIDVDPAFLRRLSSTSRKASRISERVIAAHDRFKPTLIVIEDGLGDPDRDGTAMLAEDVAKRLADRCPTRLSYRRACLQIAGQENPKACAAILSAQYDILTDRLAQARRLTITGDDRLRDQKPLLAALALAHATVLEEFLRLG